MFNRIINIGVFLPTLLLSNPFLSQHALTDPGNGSEHLFRRVLSYQSGISDAVVPPSEKARRLLDASSHFFSTDSYGGVCVGDVDQDGLPDILFTSPGGMQLYKNQGGFAFTDITKQAGLSDPDFWGWGACFADLDQDRDVDLFICGNGEPNRVYWNQGDGTFVLARQTGLESDGSNTMMSFADYDNDGDLDGYLTRYASKGMSFEADFKMDITFRNGKAVIPEEDQERYDVLLDPKTGPRAIPAGQKDSLYRNDGDGTFTDVTLAAGISGPGFGLAAIWFDHDNDGDQDLYVANDFYSPDAFYQNSGDGSFTNIIASSLPHTPWFSMGTDVADINNDGRLDLLGTDMSGSTHYKSKVGMGDMDKNLWFLTLPTPRQYMRNALYLNTGSSRFMEIAKLAGVANTDWTWSPRFSDFDNDGWVDLFVANGMTRDLTDSDLAKQAEALPRSERRAFWAAQKPKLDANMAFRNTGDLGFDPIGAEWGLDDETVTFGAVTADLDLDGDLDLVCSNLDPPLKIYENTENRNHRVTFRFHGTRSATQGTGVRIDLMAGGQRQVRELRLSQGYISSSEPLLHLGLGRAPKIDELKVRWPSGVLQRFTNLAVNARYDIREPDPGGSVEPPPPQVEQRAPSLFKVSETLAHIQHRENDFDDFEQQPLLPNGMSRLGPGMAWADVDLDGDEDLFVCGAMGQESRLYLRDADSQFTLSPNPDFSFFKEQEDLSAMFFEFNGDGAPDLYVTAGGAAYEAGSLYLHDRLYINDGAGGFRMARRQTPRITDSGGPVAAVDFDRDGDLDWFVGGRFVPGAYPSSPKSHLVLNEAGASTRIVTDDMAPGLTTAGMITAARWSDVDGDGWQDLLLATDWGPIQLWRNRDGRLENATATSGFAASSGWWNSLAIGDFDNDGDLDCAAGNTGLNTKYHASAGKPVVAHYGDMDGSGKASFVESYYEGDTWFPVRGRSCSTYAMPNLSPRFPDFDSFAKATVYELFPVPVRDKALRVEVNELRSGVFLNDGSGVFSFTPFPRLAQAAPGFGLEVLDMDNDGIKDLYMVQNFFSPQPETGRYDGGLSVLLKGVGDGSFSVVPPLKSGLIVPGDAKALAITDLNRDGHMDFAITINDGPMMSFIRQAEEPSSALQVRLEGPAGNPAAAGARLLATFADGRVQAAESGIGGGYLSHAPARLSFSTKSQALKELVVSWPDGRESTHVPQSQRGEWQITHPSLSKADPQK